MKRRLFCLSFCDLVGGYKTDNSCAFLSPIHLFALKIDDIGCPPHFIECRLTAYRARIAEQSVAGGFSRVLTRKI